MIIDKNSHVPAYCQLKDYLKSGIQNGEWEEKIPSEHVLCAQSNVTRMTVRQAIGELVNEGLLYRVHGKGTFVTKQKIEQTNIMSFSELLACRGMTPRTVVLVFERIDSPLSLPAFAVKDSFYRIRRLRCADKTPIGIEEIFLPCDYCPNLESHDLTTSFYAILQTYGYKIATLDVSIEASIPTDVEATALNAKKSTPVLRVEGRSLLADGTALFYERDVYLSDRFSYKVRILDKHDF